MFTVFSRFRPLDDWDINPVSQMFDTREEALQHGTRSSCMSGITDVDVYDGDTAIATYTRLTNYWFEFKNTEGKPVSRDKFFSIVRKKTEQRAISDDFNIRIRHQGLRWRVLAGEHSIPIDEEMLPWVSEAVEETERKIWEREEDGLEGYIQKEILNMFSEYLQNRITKALEKNPACFSRLRREKPFNNL